MLIAMFQILSLICDLAAVLYLFGVLRDHAANRHAPPSLIKLSSGLLLIMAASIFLRLAGYPRIALLLAALPIILAACTLGFVFLVSSTSSWK